MDAKINRVSELKQATEVVKSGGVVDTDLVRQKIGLVREEIKKYGANEAWIEQSKITVENFLYDKNWYERWKLGKMDDSEWKGAFVMTAGGIRNLNDNPNLQQALARVSWLMVGEKVLEEEERKEDQEIKREIVYDNDPPPIKDGVIIESSENKVGSELKDGEAIVQYEGIVVEQRKVGDRMTCILAVMQMLLSHSGYIRLDSKLNLVEAKGEMLKVADNLGALSTIDGGTIRLNDLDGSVRPVLESTMTSLIKSGVSKNDSELGNITVNTLTEISGGQDGAARQEKLLNDIEAAWSKGKNVIYGYTMTDTTQYSGYGHERVINGVGKHDGKTYFHIIDPISGGVWQEKEVVAKSLSGPIFVATSNERATVKISFDGVKRNGSQKVVWG